MGGVRVNVAASFAAKAARGEEKDESDHHEAPDDHGFLGAAPSNGESRIHTDGCNHDVHLGAPVATATALSLVGGRYKDITGDPFRVAEVSRRSDPTSGELLGNA
jgi:hypothetical protein